MSNSDAVKKWDVKIEVQNIKEDCSLLPQKFPREALVQVFTYFGYKEQVIPLI